MSGRQSARRGQAVEHLEPFGLIIAVRHAPRQALHYQAGSDARTLRDALGLSVFLVTHDLDTLYTICDRVAVLAEKRVLVADRLDVVAATDNPWIHDYFHGPRGRAAAQAATRVPGSV